MKHIRRTLAGLVALLGLVHIAFTPVFYPGWGLSALWFAGTGLALVVLGFANALLVGRTEKWANLCGAAANFASLTLLAMVAIQLGQLHAWVGVALVFGLFATGVLDASPKPDKAS